MGGERTFERGVHAMHGECTRWTGNAVSISVDLSIYMPPEAPTPAARPSLCHHLVQRILQRILQRISRRGGTIPVGDCSPSSRARLMHTHSSLGVWAPGVRSKLRFRQRRERTQTRSDSAGSSGGRCGAGGEGACGRTRCSRDG